MQIGAVIAARNQKAQFAEIRRRQSGKAGKGMVTGDQGDNAVLPQET